jgi:hypothetical protein
MFASLLAFFKTPRETKRSRREAKMRARGITPQERDLRYMFAKTHRLILQYHEYMKWEKMTLEFETIKLDQMCLSHEQRKRCFESLVDNYSGMCRQIGGRISDLSTALDIALPKLKAFYKARGETFPAVKYSCPPF